jgi:hypothetical protein
MTELFALFIAITIALLGSLIAYSVPWTLAGDMVILPDNTKPSENMHGIVVTNRCFSAVNGVPFSEAELLRGLEPMKALGDITLFFELK